LTTSPVVTSTSTGGSELLSTSPVCTHE
jgi:hypothetical protein